MELPFEKIGQKLTVLSYGVGQDSTAILVRILHDIQFRKKYVKGHLIVVTADTKNEHVHTYGYRNYIKMLCQKQSIPFYVLDPKDYATGAWTNGLVGFYQEKDAVGSKAFPKTCTDNLKIKPIYKFLEKYIHEEFNLTNYGNKKAFYEYLHKYGKIRVLIGIAAGEEKRASQEPTGMKWFDQCVEKVYPLIEENMDRKACQVAIQNEGYMVPMPSNCILCPFMSLQELLYLYRYQYDDFILWTKLEKAKMEKHKDKGDKNLGVWGTTRNLWAMLDDAIKLHGHMTKEELEEYKFSHGHCVQSKY